MDSISRRNSHSAGTKSGKDMSRRNSFVSTSPVLPATSNEESAMATRHDSVHSAQDLEIADLTRQVVELKTVEAQELQICKSDVDKKKDEIRKFTGQLSRQTREYNDLEDKMTKLREETEREVRDIQSELDREKKRKRTAEDQGAETIAQLQTEVAAKENEIKELEARLSNIKLSPNNAYCGVETTSADIHPTTMHHEPGCEEYQKRIFQQLGDAQELQAAAEAEADGFRHLAEANADLTDGHAIDLACIRELEKEKEQHRIEVEHLEEVLAEMRVEQHRTSELIQQAQSAKPAPQSLGFSNVMSYVSIPDLAPKNNKAEITEYMHQLRVAELEIDSLNSEKQILLTEHAELEAQFVSALSMLKVQEQHPSPALVPSSALTFSDLQTISTTPLPRTAASTPIADAALIAELEGLGDYINNLSTVSPKTITLPTKMQNTSELPNVALTINIKPTNKRNYSLLQRVKSVISANSKLDIHGPEQLVKQFVASMNDIEKDHVEKTKLVIDLDQIAQQHRANIEILESQLRNKAKCSDSAHRRLADDLKAKTEQLAMQEQLLAKY